MTDEAMRLDKWLWHARLFKSRTTAARLCQAGRIRVDGTVIVKASHPVRPGNVLTFPQAREIRVVRVLALGTRRGPAVEARGLYEDVPSAAHRPPPPRVPSRGAAAP